MATAMKMKRESPAEEPMSEQATELLYQALETELGGVQVYETAIRCAKNSELKKEWKKYLSQTERHVKIVRGVFDELGLDPEAPSPGRAIVNAKGQALVAAMEMALASAPKAAEIVAAECVVDAETKDHANWQLIGAVAEISSGEVQKSAVGGVRRGRGRRGRAPVPYEGMVPRAVARLAGARSGASAAGGGEGRPKCGRRGERPSRRGKRSWRKRLTPTGATERPRRGNGADVRLRARRVGLTAAAGLERFA